METATWVLVSLCVLQVQTLYYSADHKLLDGGLLEGQAEVFGAEEDHIQFVQVHNQHQAPARLDRKPVSPAPLALLLTIARADCRALYFSLE